MSKLARLIAELCPDGVEEVRLGDIVSYAKGRIDAASMTRESYVGVDNLLPNKQGKTTAHYVPKEGSVIAFQSGDVLIGNIRPYLRKIWLATTAGGTNGDVLVLQIQERNRLAPAYLYYALSSESFFLYAIKHSKGAKMPRGDKDAILHYSIPLPPLPVQEEIVRILDTFTELTTELTAELTAELAKRKQQYAYYRDKLFSFDDVVEYKTLGDICKKICSGGTPSTSNRDYYNGIIPWLRTQEIDWKDIYDTEIKISKEAVKNSSAKMIPANCVIVAMYGATAAKVAINKIPLTTNQACCNLEIDNIQANYRYVYHFLCHQYSALKALGQGSQANINAKIVREYKIPLPPLSEQARIVDILDRFDALCHDLTSGLPAEIEARKKQYEYYRDRLLTFPVKREV